MRTILAKHIIQPNNNFNLYHGCTHGCIYCDSRSLCYNLGEFEDIGVKANALKLMDQELSHKRKHVILTTGGMSDPYVHLEATHRLTEGALKLVAKHKFGIYVLTKSAMILRDIELYKLIDKQMKSIVALTITTHSDELAAKIEPNVSRPSERFAVLRAFHEAGITTGIWMTPILPFITDTEANIKTIVAQAKAAGVDFILSFGIGTTMREGSREYFYTQLDRSFPGLKEKYISEYGNKYICPVPQAEKLKKIFKEACDQAGIIHDHKLIKNLFVKNHDLEPTLFDFES